MLVLACLAAPISEFFDQWDAEGISNDTEFGVVALIFLLCLVLLVGKLVSLGAFRFGFRSLSVIAADNRRRREFGQRLIFVVPPLVSPPLRI